MDIKGSKEAISIEPIHVTQSRLSINSCCRNIVALACAASFFQ